ncbi:NifB/NifX family molybdenum-iron cluster-binding protein [Parabacteroides sp. OttesenSCG-928-G07]|nr:NifB/NifX family molybdenum-iron cluster-binding protein [Parabacteroides sp. OttesenSCG-928-G07]
MVVAITSLGKNMTDKVDQHFGRCPFFVFYDTESQTIEVVPNPHQKVVSRAGFASVLLLLSHGASKIIAGEIGIKAKQHLDKHHIQIIIPPPEKTIEEIIELIKASEH